MVVYDKLVRDEIPAIIEGKGKVPVIHTATDEEFDRRLLEKLDEEVAEFRESGEVEELADVLEIVYTICEREGVSAEQLEAMREQKADERGGFEEGVVLERVEE